MKQSHQPKRNIRVRAVRRNPPDLKQLSRALIQVAEHLAEKEMEKKKPMAHRFRPPLRPKPKGAVEYLRYRADRQNSLGSVLGLVITKRTVRWQLPQSIDRQA